ncbi:Oidioi.mRNA.OKI2018_I69.XSR.g15497.t1.cds [Oikopleura dioica]|uniref:Oidioi.mRNA.OKI2018_I69.XSR.g15497.t1.cds n=1 Tax=Oikopleura dioica TaxID=34765 RepID=A0ABN7SKG0_OIKDI|nr:Oidioi.mRNA.OKI2018_I69.XSR.g15497.t1.cds [Oikopleura dioica]
MTAEGRTLNVNMNEIVVKSNTVYEADNKNSEATSSKVVRRKRRRTMWEGESCVVCGDRASGYHYNVLSCEGCKGFYRRVVTEENKILICKFGGKCKMDLYWRRKCGACRLKKCQLVGMRPEYVSNREAKKREKPRGKTTEVKKPLPKKQLSEEQRNEASRIAELVTEEYRVLCEATNAKTLEKLESIADIGTRHVQSLVAFCKKLPGFDSLPQADQVALIKASTVDASFLRSAFSFAMNPEKQMKQTNKIIASLKNEAIDLPVRRFYDRFAAMKPSMTMIGLLVAMAVFSADRAEGITEPQLVEEAQVNLVKALQFVCIREDQPKLFPKLVLKLTDLRYLNHAFSNLLKHESNSHLMNPLLRELWDLE